MSILEKNIERKFIDECENYGLVAIKLTIIGWVGWPDRLVIGPDRKIFFVELKRMGHTPSLMQLTIHKLLRDFGFCVYVPDNIEECYEIIKKEMAT